MTKRVNGDQEIFVLPDQSTHTPAGIARQLSNPGVIDCKKAGIVCIEDKQ